MEQLLGYPSIQVSSVEKNAISPSPHPVAVSVRAQRPGPLLSPCPDASQPGSP